MHAESVACKVMLEHVDAGSLRAVGKEETPLRMHPSCAFSAHIFPQVSGAKLTAHEGSFVRIDVRLTLEAAPALAMNRQAVSQKRPKCIANGSESCLRR
jgi:hypothetical protein